MTAPGVARLDDYDFALPRERIAHEPLAERDAARLLRVDCATGALVDPSEDARVRDLPRFLRAGDLLVVNATRVLPARLRGRKRTGGRVEALLLGETPDGAHRAFVKSSGRLRVGLTFDFGPADAPVTAELVSLHEGGEVALRFAPGALPYEIGEAPLPPYIARPDVEQTPERRAADLARYQTVFAREPGAVAAPTAGLHLTAELLARLEAMGVARAEVVLHVGAGTFKPVTDADIARGRLHEESYELPEETAEQIERTRASGGRVIAVGTTSTRVLEACADASGKLRPGRGKTDLFLRPGAPIRVIDGLLTNFHLPRSSLLMLVAALVGREPLLAAYRHAVESEYRFYSYGDAMLIL